jgi:phospholipid/cholesterol/gamma-HCH transport system permease protein
MTSPAPSAPASGAQPIRENFFAMIGDLVVATIQTIREIPIALRYPKEILRQLAILLLSNAIPIWIMLFTIGAVLAEIGTYVLLQIGAQAYIGLFTSAASVKATNAIFFAIIVSAKTATGYVAELGAMRINEEVDALEVMGIPSRPYLIGTRIIACLIGLPMLSAIGNVISFTATYLGAVYLYRDVSAGGYLHVFWSFVTPTDLMVSSPLWTMGGSMVAVMVGCHYGYTAKGGPVGVGQYAARSMAFNVVMCCVVAAVFFQAVYGTGVILPIGN